MSIHTTVEHVRESIGRERSLAYLFVLPAVATVVLLTIGPLIWSAFMTFHRWYPAVHPAPEFNGFGNYIWVFSQPRFWNAVVNFLYYGIVGTAIQIIIATALALALYNYVDDARIRVGLLILFVMPMMFASVIVAGIWSLMFSPGGGIVNGLLNLIGIDGVNWLGSRWLGLTAIIIADIWQWTGFPLIIIYSGRTAISDSMYEAARIDGASTWMTFKRITLPQLKNLIVIAIILRFLGMYKLFDKLFVMTRGGPGTATELPTYLAYTLSLRQFQIGRGATLTWILVIGVGVFMYAIWKISSNDAEAQR